MLIALAVKVVFLFHDADWFETLGILIAIFLASFISTISEYGSEKAFKRLQDEATKIKSAIKSGKRKVEKGQGKKKSTKPTGEQKRNGVKPRKNDSKDREEK